MALGKRTKLYNIEVDYVVVVPITAVLAMSRDRETYFVIRNDNSEAEVIISNGVIVEEKPRLTDEERYYFTSGQYKELKKYY